MSSVRSIILCGPPRGGKTLFLNKVLLNNKTAKNQGSAIVGQICYDITDELYLTVLEVQSDYSFVIPEKNLERASAIIICINYYQSNNHQFLSNFFKQYCRFVFKIIIFYTAFQATSQLVSPESNYIIKIANDHRVNVAGINSLEPSSLLAAHQRIITIINTVVNIKANSPPSQQNNNNYNYNPKSRISGGNNAQTFRPTSPTFNMPGPPPPPPSSSKSKSVQKSKKSNQVDIDKMPLTEITSRILNSRLKNNERIFLPPHFTKEDLKKVRLKLSRRLHPDVHPQQTQKMQNIYSELNQIADCCQKGTAN